MQRINLTERHVSVRKLLILNFWWVRMLINVGVLAFDDIIVNTRAFEADLVSMYNFNIERRISSFSSLTEWI